MKMLSNVIRSGLQALKSEEQQVIEAQAHLIINHETAIKATKAYLDQALDIAANAIEQKDIYNVQLEQQVFNAAQANNNVDELTERLTERDQYILELEAKIELGGGKVFTASIEQIRVANGKSRSWHSLINLRIAAHKLGDLSYTNEAGEESFTIGAWSKAYGLSIIKALK